MFTQRNIEDWDFRDVEPGSEADRFLSDNYLEVVAVETGRLSWIESLVQNGLAALSEDGEYVTVIRDCEINPEWESSDFRIFYGMTHSSGIRDKLTRVGRFDARMGRSLWREWQKYGRIKVRLTPDKGRGRRP